MRFEKPEELSREEVSIKMLCDKFGLEYEKLGANDIDFRVTKDGRICHVEVKGRNRNIAEAYPLPLSARKMVKIYDKKTEGILVWACFDGIIYGNIKEIESIGKKGGRKPRVGAVNDIEYMLYFYRQLELKEMFAND